jgi:hypothetical protein
VRRPALKYLDDDEATTSEPLKVSVVEPLRRVRVVAPYQVVYETIVYRPGDVPDIPVALADRWVRDGWVEELL